MGFFEALFGKSKNKPPGATSANAALCDLTAEYAAQRYAFEICAELIARAVAKCDFQTYKNSKRIKGREWYLWNVEPNPSQNSTEFWQEFVRRMLWNGEALAVPIVRNGDEKFLIADSFGTEERSNGEIRYTGVVCGSLQFNKRFAEADVLHCKYAPSNLRAVADALYLTQAKMLQSATDAYIRSNSVRMKVKVSQMAAAAKDFQDTFAAMMEANVKPFSTSYNGVLPQFDGYEYENFKTGEAGSVKDYRELFENVVDSYAKAFGIPPVLIHGEVANSEDAMNRWLTTCIDPLCYQIEEEINRKRYGFAGMQSGTFLHIDTSTIQHFDMFGGAEKIEKLIGSGAYSINDVIVAAGGVALPDAWADRHWLTLNISNIETAATAVEEVSET